MSTEHLTGGEFDLAVVGLAGRFPGAADIDEFWSRVLRGEPTVRRFSADELAAAGVPESERTRPDYVPVFGDVSDVDRFDAGFFGYTPRDARLLDPQQRLFLESAWHALEGAGHVADVDRLVVGVYAAVGTAGYLVRNLLPAADAAGSDYEVTIANEKDAVATRTAYHLGLRGPAIAVQTACSSSLVAVHQAGQALLAGECDLALAGAAHVRLPLRAGYRYEPGGIMSRTGVCRPFDAAADGAVGGSGVAVVALRRLADALADGDTIHAVVRGSAVNNDGAAKPGYTAPSVDGQVAVIRTAHAAADVATSSIGYVETHGTGTALGDQIEFAALRSVFGPRGRCALGSVKAVTGHLDAAAGVTGFVKACLAVRDGVVPPSPYFTAPHPDLGLAASAFFVPTAVAPWPVTDGPRLAGVSSFGIGGTNAHVVVGQPPDRPAAPADDTEHVLVLSARTAPALATARADLAAHLDRAGAASDLADVAATLQRTRRRFDHRFAVACRDHDEAVAALTGGPAADTANGELTGGTVAFLFPGQGTQYAGMGEGLYRHDPVFRSEVDTCAELLGEHLDLDLRHVLHRDRDDALLRRTRIAQPALFTVEYALARWWQDRGIEPAALVGHSVGEFVAACLADVLTLPDALALVAARGELMEAMPPGAMVSVALPSAELASRLPAGVEIAAVNAPRLCTVAGPRDAVAALAGTLRAEGVRCRELHTSHAFHSAMMTGAAEGFADHAAGIPLRAPRIPVLSNVTGDWLSARDATDPAYWARQLRAPVRFDDGVRRLLDARHALLEVGPGDTLTTLTRQRPEAIGRGTPSLPGPAGAGDDRLALAGAAGRLWLAGVAVDWTRLGATGDRRRVPLPGYPFARDRHWVDPPGHEPDSEPVTGDTVESVPVSEAVRRIWSDLLGIPDVGPDDDFFALGGHSLLATKVVARLREAFDVDLPTSALFDTPTIAGLVATVESLLTAPPPPPDPAPTADRIAGLLAEIRAMSPTEVRGHLVDTHGEEPR
ncbi:polyketide synthase type I [Actinophytocola xinjiangensis]|uniref:Polyketide synthase type I n=1 Tax=Actinophytocola xinjiangensis TaxID=485602 RepID=A0A7Z0WIA0_9PSEU|nr:type I polyketide synthase [Actinophytocola xinjiangensis]OLF07377.1 polyketide synthase type I [Actinophytocola xinjiangensis]